MRTIVVDPKKEAALLGWMNRVRPYLDGALSGIEWTDLKRPCGKSVRHPVPDEDAGNRGIHVSAGPISSREDPWKKDKPYPDPNGTVQQGTVPV